MRLKSNNANEATFMMLFSLLPLGLFAVLFVSAEHMMMGGTSLEEIFSNLVSNGEMTVEQKSELLQFAAQMNGAAGTTAYREELSIAVEDVLAYLQEQTENNRMPETTAFYVQNVMDLVRTEPVFSAVQANYDPSNSTGVVSLAGRWDEEATTQTNSIDDARIYAGIWGYATGSREYALLCNHRYDTTERTNTS